MTDREAMKMALDALDAWLVADVTKLPIVIPQTENTVFALRQALAQPEQVSIEPPDYVEPITFDYHEGWEEGFKAGVESVKNKKESTPSNVDSLLHGGDGNYIKQAQPEQEPVVCDCGDHITPNSGAMCGICASIKPSKPWVSLTDEEVKSILDCGRGGLVDIKKTEQLIKERNT